MNSEHLPPQDNNDSAPDFSGYPVTDPDIFLGGQEIIESLVSKSRNLSAQKTLEAS